MMKGFSTSYLNLFLLDKYVSGFHLHSVLVTGCKGSRTSHLKRKASRHPSLSGKLFITFDCNTISDKFQLPVQNGVCVVVNVAVVVKSVSLSKAVDDSIKSEVAVVIVVVVVVVVAKGRSVGILQ